MLLGGLALLLALQFRFVVSFDGEILLRLVAEGSESPGRPGEQGEQALCCQVHC